MATPARPSPNGAGRGSASHGRTRAATPLDATRDITVIPRAVISAAVGVVHTVERAVSGGPVRTARDNAWDAVCADRALARQRDELRRAAAARAAGHFAVGSSPRSRAAQV